MGRDLIPTHGIFSANSTMEGSMPDSLFSREFQSVFSQVRDTGGTPKAFPSPIDWRDQGISFLMVDRFNNTRSTPPQALRRSDLLRFQGQLCGDSGPVGLHQGGPVREPPGSAPFSRMCLWRKAPTTGTASITLCVPIRALPTIPHMQMTNCDLWWTLLINCACT